MESQERLAKIPIWEVMTEFNERSALGRVVINPPGRMAPLVPHPTGEEWFLCKKCGFACLSREKMFTHREKHLQPETHDEESDEDEEDEQDEGLGVGNGNDSDEDIDLKFKDKRHFQCGICRKVFRTPGGLRSHKLAHQTARPEKCGMCQATFKTKACRNKHMRKSHNKAFENCCLLCPCRFEKEQGLLSHMVWYHGTKFGVARIVPDTTGTDSQADEVKKQKTEKTENQFLKKSKTIMTKKYSGSIKIKFSISSKYAVSTRLDRSIVLKAIHQNSKTYDCQVCEKTYASRVSFMRHLRTHNDEKPYTCKRCGARFRHGNSLKQHVKSNHGNGAYRCYYCPCKLGAEWIRTQHCFKYHPNQIIPGENIFADDIVKHVDEEDCGMTMK